MSPAEQAAAVYLSEPCARMFEEDLDAHLLHGLVYSTPTAFGMARYVCSAWPHEWIVDPWFNSRDHGTHDTLHVYLAAGNLREILALPHFPAAFISFERQNRLRFYDYDQLTKRCKTT